MFCIKCGSKQPDKATFCGSCGNLIHSNNNQTTTIIQPKSEAKLVNAKCTNCGGMLKDDSADYLYQLPPNIENATIVDCILNKKNIA